MFDADCIGASLTSWVDNFGEKLDAADDAAKSRARFIYERVQAQHDSYKNDPEVMCMVKRPVVASNFSKEGGSFRDLIGLRACAIGLSMTPPAGMAIQLLARGNPAQAVMYLYYLRHLQVASISGYFGDGKIHEELLTLDRLKVLIPAPLDDDALSAIWRDQKCALGNGLDHINPAIDFGELNEPPYIEP